MGKLYINSGGGLGDFIYNYFKSYEWQCLSTIYQFFSDAQITAVLTHHSPTCGELLYTHPAIIAVMTSPWRAPGDPLEYSWKGLVQGENVLSWARNNNIRPAHEHGLEHKIYLTDKEEYLIANIKNKGPYIVMHPFAGLPHRGSRRHPYDNKYKCYPDYKYIQTANYLIEKGISVVFVGRSTYDGVDRLRDNEETLSEINGHILSSEAYNLINKVSTRVSVELTRRANGFIGSHSSMLSAAWTNQVPSVFFYPGYDEHGNYRSVKEHGGTTGTWALGQSWNAYYELKAEEFLELDPQEPAEKLINLINRK
jgi:hypothetical protein